MSNCMSMGIIIFMISAIIIVLKYRKYVGYLDDRFKKKTIFPKT